MRPILIAAMLSLFACGAQAEPQLCFKDCIATRIDQDSDDIKVKDAARECRQICEDKNRDVLQKAGELDQIKDCKAEALSIEDFKKVRAVSPSFYVQSNVFIWNAKNPFPDKVITKIEVKAQNIDLNDVGFTGTGIVPPNDGIGTFVIPGFYDGYPGARLAAKIQKVYACPLK